MITFTIDLPPRTKKNHQQIRFNRKTGKPFVSQSDAYKAYEAAALMMIPKSARQLIDYPVNIKALYYMDTHRIVDRAGLEQCLNDVLVRAGVIKDDNSRIAVASDGSRVLYDKDHPRTEVTITPMEEQQ